MPFQETEAEFSAKILPWRQCQCHRDTDMGDHDSLSSPESHAAQGKV